MAIPISGKTFIKRQGDKPSLIAQTSDSDIDSTALNTQGNSKHYRYNKTQHDANTLDLCLHELFEQQADLFPQRNCLAYGAETMSFQELDEKANQLARWLQGCGIGAGSLVGVYLERSMQPFIAMLAILKSGAAYVMIDTTFPLERIRYMLNNAKVHVLVTEQTLAVQASEFFDGTFDGTTVLMDALAQQISKLATARLSRLESGVSPHDLCYVVYTSGTTGHPKGVMTEHRNVVNYVTAIYEIYQVKHTDSNRLILRNNITYHLGRSVG